MTVLDRFIRYVQIDTQSDATSTSAPSTKKQYDLLNLLVKELKELGISNAHVDSHGVVYATLAANTTKLLPKIGFIAHVDTASELTGKNVLPRVIRNYDGKDIVLNEASNIIMKVDDFPLLSDHVGLDLVVTDGTTLLGADDKAGVAEIMTFLEYLLSHKEVPHGIIQIAFTPDEEIGRGTAHFDIPHFNADFAYTIDGSKVGSVDFENFNAAAADVTLHGRSIHPGSAKGKMINAMHLGMEFHRLLPPFENPAFTENYEGFNHLVSMNGSVDECHMHYILRNHDLELLDKQKKSFDTIAQFLNNTVQPGCAEVTITPTYYNMKESLADKMYIVDLAKQATQKVGITPFSIAIRGGTDGAQLTYKGLPCPNLGTGGYNYHGRYEYAVIQEMEQSVQVLIEIVRLSTQYPFPSKG